MSTVSVDLAELLFTGPSDNGRSEWSVREVSVFLICTLGCALIYAYDHKLYSTVCLKEDIV